VTKLALLQEQLRPLFLPNLERQRNAVEKRFFSQMMIQQTTGEKSLTIQMQQTISKASTSEGVNRTVEVVKSLFEELKSRKDLISQLQELEDPTYAAEILTNKMRIIKVRPIFILIRSFRLIITAFPDFS
jgi:transcription elongation factor GreA-like protein